MPSREELIDVVVDSLLETLGDNVDREDAEWIVGALLARWPHIAGPQRIEYQEQISALPEGSIVMDDSGVTYKKDGPGHTFWLGFGDEGLMPPSCIDLPATVLFQPDAAPGEVTG